MSRPFLRLGRNARCDLQLKDPQVSQRHVYLQVVHGRVLCVDMLSQTGTHWQTGRGEYGWLDYGKPISIGPYEVGLEKPLHVLSGCPSPPGNPLKTSQRESGVRRITLEFLGQRTVNRTVGIGRVATLFGRSESCKIELRDKSVSRIHCCLLSTPAGAWIVDLVSREGTRVNGERVAFAFLEDGCELQIGKFRTRVHYEGEPIRFIAPYPPNPPPAAAALIRHGAPVRGTANDDRAPAVAFVPSPTALALVDSTTPLPASIAPVSLPARTADAELRALLTEQNGKRTDELVPELLRQLATFHQQMFEQNQQTISMIVQLFSRMHREHVEMVRDELNRLDQLTDEMRTVHAELARVSAARNRSASERPAAELPPSEPKTEPAIVSTLPEEAASFTGATASIDSGDASAKTDIDHAPVPSPAPPPVEAVSITSHPAPPTNPDDIHVWLVQRMAAIETERQSIWDRVCAVFKIPP